MYSYKNYTYYNYKKGRLLNNHALCSLKEQAKVNICEAQVASGEDAARSGTITSAAAGALTDYHEVGLLSKLANRYKQTSKHKIYFYM